MSRYVMQGNTLARSVGERVNSHSIYNNGHCGTRRWVFPGNASYSKK